MTTKTTLLRGATPFLIYAASIPILVVSGFGLSGTFAMASFAVSCIVLLLIAAAYLLVAGLLFVSMVDPSAARAIGLHEYDENMHMLRHERAVVYGSIWHVPFLVLLGAIMTVVPGLIIGSLALIPAASIAIISWMPEKA